MDIERQVDIIRIEGNQQVNKQQKNVKNMEASQLCSAIPKTPLFPTHI